MKKIIYMLPLAICLILAGCAKWDEFEPLPADTWGAESELTVETPDTVTTTELPITVITRNANYVALLVSDTAMVNINYTTLMQGQYAGASRFETNYEADTLNLTLNNVVAGNTYHLYVVATNKAGVQSTFNKAIGAVDVTAPVITSTFPLTPTNGGRTVTLAFNETIVRESGAGAITYQVLDGTMTEAFKGTVAETDIEASGRNLRVSLPASVEFAEGVQYAILLSFAQGAVSDVYGNPMAAINNQLEDGGLPSGPWWRYINEGGGGDTPSTDEFFHEGEYFFAMMFDGGSGEQQLSTTANFSYTGDFDISGWGEYFTGITAQEWSISGFLEGSIQGVTPVPFPAFSYEMTEQGQTYELMTMMVASADAPLPIAQYQGQDVYLVDFIESESKLYINVEFMVATDPDLGKFAMTISECPALAIQGQGGYSIIATLADMQFLPTSSLQAPAKKNAFTATVVPVDNIHNVRMGGVKHVSLNNLR